ncbi:phosphonate ABC transporter, permease protein PhnE [Roseicella sp. DB1501]|uniref:phosphonate ABC transporter, permease protein PhnE n=1 Tax=Roseicella sp. DB1501 TaxID=2730925 RepID=UPI001492A50A|nr:phosphonate ABC transporter, permease protein PhnE [Roseicella sp. DB1501]NOG69970.1 phosphonate ABC transporter, permease protein PhnE [Roseicella sp. DB1501]
MRRLAGLLALALLYGGSLLVVRPDLPRLWAGLPRLSAWLGGAFPPDFSGLPDLLHRAAETVGIATLGTTLAMLLALPITLLAARPVAPIAVLYHPARAVLDALRGIDGFVFALIFVAAVGLGPFAGMLGIALHSAGSIGKLWSEVLETADPAPLEAVLTAGGSRAQAAAVVLLPDALPQLASALLYVWEFNIRASTVLGLVGAGGLGQELKNAVDLLDFARVLAILAIIVALVLAADRLSGLLRRQLG